MGGLFAFLDPSPTTLLILGALAVMLFGDRLPEVARSFGKSFMEVKKGVSGLQREIEDAVQSAGSNSASSSSSSRPGDSSGVESEDHEEATAPKFEPPPAP